MSNYPNTQGDCAQFTQHFATEAARKGYQYVPTTLPIGKKVRGPAFGKSESNKSAEYFIHDDCRGGWINDYTTGEWFSITAASSGHNDVSLGRFKPSQDKVNPDKELAEKYADAANKANYILGKCVAPSSHEYLRRKAVTAPGSIARYSPKFKTLVLPILCARTSEVTSLQYIDANGGKKYMPGGRIKGCYIACSSVGDQLQILLCEGWATGRTLSELHPSSMVLAAHNCGNLKPVAEAVKQRWPDRRLIICGDDDRANEHNPGRTKAEQAALAVGADLMLPNWPDDAPLDLSDFNDLARWQRAQF